ncbi:transcription elongation factor GreA [Patescibacteria group bacterium]
MSKPTQVTKEGLKALEEELRDLVEEKRPKLVDRLANARSQGDLSENSDYQNARDDLEFLDGRIAELQEVITSAQVVTGGNNKGAVDVGTKVTLKVNGSRHVYDIVGDWEADPAEKKISHTSPLGQSLVGKKKGEKVQVEAPAGNLTYEILKID